MQITKWIKRIGRPSKWYRVMFISTLPLHTTDNFEFWFTDPDNRVLRCRPDIAELKALYEHLGKFFEMRVNE